MTNLDRQTAAVIASGDPELDALALFTVAMRSDDREAMAHWEAVLAQIERGQIDTAKGGV